jgi:hypothetical protein
MGKKTTHLVAPRADAILMALSPPTMESELNTAGTPSQQSSGNPSANEIELPPDGPMFGPELPPGSLVSEKGEIYISPTRPIVVTRTKAKYSKRKAGEPPKKPGPPSWIWGTKLKFFEAWKELWVKASESKMSGDFYSNMAKLYFAKYGYDLADDDDFAEDVMDPPDWVANHVANEKLLLDETKAHQALHAKVKEVCDRHDSR